MKRILSIVLIVILVFTLSSCGNSGKKSSNASANNIKDTYKGKFRVGFSRSIITPQDINVPLAGYGNPSQRIGKGYLTELTTDCVAVSDEDDNTLLIIQLDVISLSNKELANRLFSKVSQKTGVPVENIISNCSHTHSGPDLCNIDVPSMADYDEFFIETVSDNAVKALNDRAVTKKMYYGETETSQCNFIRHYWAYDGFGDKRAMGDNHWDVWWSDAKAAGGDAAYIEHITDVDPTLYVIKFEREKADDVLVTSFRAHNTFTGGSTEYVISADWVGKFRDYMEKKAGKVKCMYLQGNAGNVNPSSRIPEDNAAKTVTEQGERLTNYGLQILDNLTEINTGKVAASKFTISCSTNKKDPALIPNARLVQEYWKKTNDSTATKRYAYTLGIVSQYAANGIVNSAKRGDTMDVTASVMVIGELAFTFSPGEMFCGLGHTTIEKSPYKYTIPCSYSGYTIGYIPSSDAYDYGCYETDTCPEGKGSGEMLVDEYAKQLEIIKKNTK